MTRPQDYTYTLTSTNGGATAASTTFPTLSSTDIETDITIGE